MEMTDVIESDEAISRKEIARRLNVDIDSITNIEIL
jgi:Mn-dependent DtxR family transcriptional regulator